jgi:hypothetical protein
VNNDAMGGALSKRRTKGSGPRAVAAIATVLLGLIAVVTMSGQDNTALPMPQLSHECGELECFGPVEPHPEAWASVTRPVPKWLQERGRLLRRTTQGSAQVYRGLLMGGTCNATRAVLAGDLGWARHAEPVAFPGGVAAPSLAHVLVEAARWAPFFDHVAWLGARAADVPLTALAAAVANATAPEKVGEERFFVTVIVAPSPPGTDLALMHRAAAVVLRSSEAMQEWLQAVWAQNSGALTSPTGTVAPFTGLRIVVLSKAGASDDGLASRRSNLPACCAPLQHVSSGIDAQFTAELPTHERVLRAVADGRFALGQADDFTTVGDISFEHRAKVHAALASVGIGASPLGLSGHLWVPTERLCRGERVCRAVPDGALRRPRSAPGRPDEGATIAILGMYEVPRGAFAMEHEPLMAYDTQWNRRQYAARHGYDVVWEEPSVGPPGRTAHWAKVTALARWLPHYDWVWWLDADAVVTNLTRPVTDVLERHATAAGAAFLIAREAKTGFLNTGSFMIRGRSDASMAFLRAVFHTDEAHWLHFEQGAFNHVLDHPGGGPYTIRAGFGVEVPGRALNPFPDKWCVQTEAHQPGDLVVHMPGFKYCVNGPSKYTFASLHRYARHAADTYYSPEARRVQPCCVYRRLLHPPTKVPLATVSELLAGPLSNSSKASKSV